MSILNNCHWGIFEKNGIFWQFSQKKWQFSGNFGEKNGNFLAILGHLIGNFPEVQVPRVNVRIQLVYTRLQKKHTKQLIVSCLKTFLPPTLNWIHSIILLWHTFFICQKVILFSNILISIDLTFHYISKPRSCHSLLTVQCFVSNCSFYTYI